MKFLKYLRFTIFAIPIGLFILTYFYKDSAYLIGGIAFLLLSLFVAFPKILATKKIAIGTPKLSKNITELDKTNNPLLKPYKNILSKNYLSIIVFFLASTSLIIFITIKNLPVIPQADNFLLGYYIAHVKILNTTWFYFLALLVISTFIQSFLIGKRAKKISAFHPKLLLKNITVYLFVLLFAFIVSLPLMYLAAFIQLNSAAIQIKYIPNSIGVTNGKDAINSKLKAMSNAPHVVGSDGSINGILSVVLATSAKRDGYYLQKIIPQIPHSLILPLSLSNQPIVLVGSTLVINSIDKDSIQTVSPTLAKILLNNYFNGRNLKGDANISIVGRQDYLAFRQQQIDQEEAKIDGVIQELNKYIGSISSEIGTAKQKISANQSGLDESISARDSAYSYCINSGYYFYGYFYHTFSQAYCDSNYSSWNSIIAGYQKNINDWNSTLQYDQGLWSEAQDTKKTLQGYKQLVDLQKNTTPQELGLFTGPSQIKVVLDSTSSKAIDTFLDTLVHENLHYQSYVSEDRQLSDSFFEEGLTEYFARSVISKELNINTNVGYPIVTKIITEMMKKIPQSEFEQIYFNKDESRLESDLDNAFGKNFYKDSRYYFWSISYADADEAVKIANNILTRIGGQPVSKNDLYSSDLYQP